MRPEPPQALRDAVQSGNLVVFVGAGLSTGANLPTWPGLLHACLEWSTKAGVRIPEEEQRDLKELISSDDAQNLMAAASTLRTRLGEADFTNFLTAQLDPPGLAPTPNHLLIASLPLAGIVTTNFDTLVEKALIQSGKTEVTAITHSDTQRLATVLRRKEFFYLKAHGDVRHPETVVLGLPEYRNLKHKSPAFHQFVANLLSVHPLLFLGYSLRDTDIMLFFHSVRSRLASPKACGEAPVRPARQS